MDAYLANLDALSGQMVPFLAIAVLFVVQVVWVAAWIGRGRPNPYDFDEHADTAMAILAPDDPQLARLNRWAELDRADVLWPVADGSHDAIELTPAEVRAIEELARSER